MNTLAKLAGIVGLFVMAESGYAEFGISFSVPVIDFTFGGEVTRDQDSCLALDPDEFAYPDPKGGVKVIKKADAGERMKKADEAEDFAAAERAYKEKQGQRKQKTDEQVEVGFRDGHPYMFGGTVVACAGITGWGVVQLASMIGDQISVGHDYNKTEGDGNKQDPGDDKDDHGAGGGSSSDSSSGHLKSFRSASGHKGK
jgi:hypothetical protein